MEPVEKVFPSNFRLLRGPSGSRAKEPGLGFRLAQWRHGAVEAESARMADTRKAKPAFARSGVE